jgi:hypothetical protein
MTVYLLLVVLPGAVVAVGANISPTLNEWLGG